MQGQADLFPGLDETALPIRKPVTSDIQVRPQGQRRAFRLDPVDFETAADTLEASGRYRILRRLRARPVVTSRNAVPGENLAVIVDTETTGLDHAQDEIIEIGMVAFSYDEDGRIGDVIGTFNALREPSVPITAEILQRAAAPALGHGNRNLLFMDIQTHEFDRLHQARLLCMRLCAGCAGLTLVPLHIG